MTRGWRLTLTGYGMAVPALVVLAAFVLVPAAVVVGLSLTNWNGISPEAAFVGLGNYLVLFADPVFVRSLLNTGLYVLATLPLVLLAGMGAALLVERGGVLASLLRVVFTIPFVVSIVVVAVVWTWILDPQFGILNAALAALHLPAQGWLDDPRWAMLAIVLPSVWRQFGYYMLILLAGLKNLDPSYEEAARIDGAGYGTRVVRITVPLLGPQLFFAVAICIIDSFQVFAQVDLMTQGGPLNSTNVAIYYLYQQSFQFFHMGLASAVAVVLMVVVGALTYAQVRWIGRRVFVAG